MASSLKSINNTLSKKATELEISNRINFWSNKIRDAVILIFFLFTITPLIAKDTKRKISDFYKKWKWLYIIFVILICLMFIFLEKILSIFLNFNF